MWPHSGDVTCCHGHEHIPRYRGSVLIDTNPRARPDHVGDILSYSTQRHIADGSVCVLRFVHPPIHLFIRRTFMPLLRKLKVGGRLVVAYPDSKPRRRHMWATNVLRRDAAIWQPRSGAKSVSEHVMWREITTAWRKATGYSMRLLNGGRRVRGHSIVLIRAPNLRTNQTTMCTRQT